MIRQTRPEDLTALLGFLRQHVDSSMFLLGNIEAHGLGNETHPHGTHVLVHEEAGGITGAFGATNSGYLMCQHPGVTAAIARDYIDRLGNWRILGMTGAADQVAMFLDALPIAADAWQVNRVEPLLSRDLADLPVADARLRAPVPSDRAMLTDWFTGYLVETGILDRTTAPDHASTRAQSAVASGGVRLLVGPDGAAIGMSAVNARATDVVQLGGVYVAPRFRGQGHAGRMIAAHLAELRATGTNRAILFAASDAATGAYLRLGFAVIGSYRIAMLRAPATLQAGVRA